MNLSSLEQFLPLIIIVIVFYMLIMRPQQKKQRARQDLLRSVETGDKVVTIGGIHGVIADIQDSTVILRVADGVKLEIDRSAISSVREKANQA